MVGQGRVGAAAGASGKTIESPLPPLSSHLFSLLSPSSLSLPLFLPLPLRAWPPSRAQGDPGGKQWASPSVFGSSTGQGWELVPALGLGWGWEQHLY